MYPNMDVVVHQLDFTCASEISVVLDIGQIGRIEAFKEEQVNLSW